MLDFVLVSPPRSTTDAALSTPNSAASSATIRSQSVTPRTPATPSGSGASLTGPSASGAGGMVGSCSPLTPTPSRVRAGTASLAPSAPSSSGRERSVIDLTRSTPRPTIGTSSITAFGSSAPNTGAQGASLNSRMASAFAATGRVQPRSNSVRPATQIRASATPAPTSVVLAATGGGEQVRVKAEEGSIEGDVKVERRSPSLAGAGTAASGAAGVGSMGPPAPVAVTRPGTPIASRATPAPSRATSLAHSTTPARTTPAPTNSTPTASRRTPAPGRANSMAPFISPTSSRSTAPTSAAHNRSAPATVPRTRQASLAPSSLRRLPLSARTPTPAPRYNFFAHSSSDRGRRARSSTPYTSPYRESVAALRQALGRRIVTRSNEDDVVMVDSFTPATIAATSGSATGSPSTALVPSSSGSPAATSNSSVANPHSATALTRTASHPVSPASTINSSDSEGEFALIATQSAPVPTPSTPQRKKKSNPRPQSHQQQSPSGSGSFRTEVHIQITTPAVTINNRFPIETSVCPTSYKLDKMVKDFENALKKAWPMSPQARPNQQF